MRVIRAAFLAAGLAAMPAVAAAQTPTTTAEVTRLEDLVCAEPVNQVAICVDPQGRVVRRIDDVRPTGDLSPPDAEPAPRSVPRPIALTG